jgi:hypothetical protein
MAARQDERVALSHGARLPTAVLLLVVLLAPDASAQVAAGPPARMDPTQVETAAQASFDTSYLLGVYMTQLAVAGAPPTQAEIDEATRQYFTNGAAATGVPSSGPGAAYFTNGAAATSVPSSGPGAAYFHNGAEVMAYYPAPQVAPAPEASQAAIAAPIASESHEETAGLSRSAPSTQQAAPTGLSAPPPEAASEVRAGASRAGELTCSPAEIEMAMAIAREYASASASPFCAPPSTPFEPSSAIHMQSDETAIPIVAEPAPSCQPGPVPVPIVFSRLVVAVCGALLGALAVILWKGPKALRVAHRP